MLLEINPHPLSTAKGLGFGEHNFSIQIWIFQWIYSKNNLYIDTNIPMRVGGVKNIFL